MLKFENGQFVPASENDFVDGYGEAYAPFEFLDEKGFACQSYGTADSSLLQVQVFRKKPEIRAEDKDRSLFCVDLNGQPIEEVYCTTRADSFQLLLKLTPLFSASILSGILEELEAAAEYRDNVTNGKWKPHDLPGIRGLFAAMAMKSEE